MAGIALFFASPASGYVTAAAISVDAATPRRAEGLGRVSGRGARSDEDPGLLAQARRFKTERLHPSRTSEIRVAP